MNLLPSYDKCHYPDYYESQGYNHEVKQKKQSKYKPTKKSEGINKTSFIDS